MEKSIYWIAREDKEYPEKLKNIANPPKGLYVRGRLPQEELLTIAIVGARTSVFAAPDRFDVTNGRRLLEKRNEDVGKRGEGLFASFEVGGVAKYLASMSEEYKNLDEYARLIDEIQRSESFIAEKQIPTLNKVRRWQARWEHLKKMVRL